MQQYYTVNEAAEYLRASRRSIYRWINEGRLEATKTATGFLRISRASLQRFLGEDPAQTPYSAPGSPETAQAGTNTPSTENAPQSALESF